MGAPLLVILPLALTPPRGSLRFWWNTRTNHAFQSRWRMWTRSWGRIPRRRLEGRRGTSSGPALLGDHQQWRKEATCASSARVSGSKDEVPLAWSRSLAGTGAREWACNWSWTSRDHQWHASESLIPMIVARLDKWFGPPSSSWRWTLAVAAYVAMNSQKAHDEVTKQPHVAGRHRPGVGSDTEGEPAVGIKGSRLGSIWEEDLCLRQEGPGHPEDEAPRQHGWQNWQLAFVCDCPEHDLDQRWRVWTWCSVCRWRCLIGIIQGSPLHTAFVGTVLTSFTRLPQQTVFWNQNFGTPQQEVKGGWLLLVCHFPDALQTLDNINYG